MKTNLPLDATRLWDDVMALAGITDPARPYTRRSFTALFLEGREWLARRFAEAGLATRMDTAGNLIGRIEGSDPALGVIAIGSHSDTVPAGGRFDGIAGVATGLEIVRALRDSGIRPRHSIEVIDFLAEEPSEYGLSCIGSRGMTGSLDAGMLDLSEPGGELLRDALRRVGGDPDQLARAGRDDIRAFLELHIEQGIVLESQSLDVGIVTSIVGIRRIEIVFQGEPDHAGTTPIGLRHDALVAAAATVVSVRRAAEQLAAEGADYFVATVGILSVDPSASNIVPGRCRLVVDARTTAPALTARFVELIDRESLAHAAAAQVTRASFTTLSDGSPVACNADLRAALRQGARDLGLGETDLPSGAGHDAAFMSRICPSAMIFVPCRGGKSHAPEEWADRDAIAAGAAVIYQAVMALDRSLP
ncbi:MULTISPECIES: Zn-dependent hydrolase [Rhodopseudomonas]|uniref:Allantoate amidohydrolase n=1 Tax=Rhodopseudomonas palustris TaxID=1076 RepID=A0A0D7F3G5_RHOPL|nr:MULTISPECIES: Zn-dependent hydrolase [Rhodopseudomonas]KIZ47658.1 allantoate amidohydrolase [Rhodopseudomonas palustris]MDF3808861.1 Zn-dependent hydrolase [Rhodopseudomonas sp. BAL398]WOK19840.1 Zn-dependent hydrolase [Rhodopseudomonas sp. BAL398]